ncbi:kinase [Neiella sp. HB171785]|uniref:Kinase n=1 Tax=Neiella litorisoli TaxID=2771431 RepID=A0A8J6UGK6_9GAMM|nr:kinase [Neiella litorisoli]MBD1390301.1 kinase [Neiella litorisoli]
MEAVIKPTPQQQCFLDENGLDISYLQHAQKWFMPISAEINEHQNGAKRPLIVAINGCQGSGKSTLAAYLELTLNETFGLSVVAMSMDDFYLTKTERQQLAKSVHPLLATRGVPGTHDCHLMMDVIGALQRNETTAVPRFNKAVDDRFEASQWTKVSSAVDVIIVEGWCWGIGPQPADSLIDPLNPLEAEQDKQAVWRTYVNEQIIANYQPLYQLTDVMLMLKAPSFACVKQWRHQQEQKLAARLSADDDRSGLMSEQQIETFISYFQRLTEHGLATLPAHSHVVWQLQADRSISQVSRNKELFL